MSSLVESTSTAILHVATQYSFYSGWIIIILGIVGNTLNIFVFTQLKLFRGNRSAFYLTVESISDFLYLSLSIVLTIFTSIYGDDGTGRFPIWCKLRYMLSHVSVLTTYYMISCAAVDQFFSTNYYPHLRQMCTLKLARCITSAMVFIWIAHSIVFGMFFNIQPSVGCIISNPIFLQYASFFIYPVLVGLLPIVIASLFSLLAFRNVRRIVRRQLPVIRRRLDRQMTALVLIHAICFVSLILPYSFSRIYVINFPVSKNQPLEYAISQLLQAIFLSFVRINSGINFYVFMMTSSRFRHQVKYVLIKKCWKRMKHWLGFEKNQIGPSNVELDGANMEMDDNA